MDNNGKRNGNTWNPVLVGVVSAVLGSGGAISVMFGTPIGQEIARPDPFTGKQGATLIERVSHLERDMATHVNTHPDMVNQFDRRITVLEVQYEGITSMLERIEKKLDRLSP